MPALKVLLAAALLTTTALAQSSSTSDPAARQHQAEPSTSRPRQPIEPGGSGITLETSEALFTIATALNACGYDTGLQDSAPVRTTVRQSLNEALAASAPARDARDALCLYITQHALANTYTNLGQYISLALYITPPPALTPTVPETELPPDSTQVVNILPLLRTFAETTHLHTIYLLSRPAYEAILARVHDPMTRMILDTNIYLKQPPSAYDNRRFQVLLEPMLAPATTNARIYGLDYITVASPLANLSVRMDEVRHTYLHYTVEPMVYARANAMERLQPLLKAVQDAPLDYTYKTDVAALLTECLIKAIEARTSDLGIPAPPRPARGSPRSTQIAYENTVTLYDKQADIIRRKIIDRDMRQGWVLAEYFYNRLGLMEQDGTTLRDEIGPMVFGMEVEREAHHAQQVPFFPEGSPEVISTRTRPKRTLSPADQAELALIKGDREKAEELATAILKSDPTNAEAHFLMGRLELTHNDPVEAQTHFAQVLAVSKDPRTLAWTHIYLGRLYDTQHNPDTGKLEREKAIAEYKQALAVRDAKPDTKLAAEKGLKEPFALPKREHKTSDDAPDPEDTPLDPSGKAAKDAYKPPPPPSAPK